MREARIALAWRARNACQPDPPIDTIFLRPGSALGQVRLENEALLGMLKPMMTPAAHEAAARWSALTLDAIGGLSYSADVAQLDVDAAGGLIAALYVEPASRAPRDKPAPMPAPTGTMEPSEGVPLAPARRVGSDTAHNGTDPAEASLSTEQVRAVPTDPFLLSLAQRPTPLTSRLGPRGR